MKKISLYFISLYLLFLFILIKTINIPISFSKDAVFIGWYDLLSNNIIPLILIGLMLIQLLIYLKIKYLRNGVYDAQKRVVAIEEEKTNDATEFLLSTVIPVAFFDFTDIRDIIIAIIVILVIGFIDTNTKKHTVNLTLVLIGFKYYTVNLSDGKKYDIITFNELSKDSIIEIRCVKGDLYFAK